MAGGRVGRIGVAGFVLGGKIKKAAGTGRSHRCTLWPTYLFSGGLSMFSSRTGFACDSVEEFEVVLASGDVILANADANSDLLIALLAA